MTVKVTWTALALSLLSMLGWAYTEYSRNDRVDIQRISVLESHRTDTDIRLERIEDKLDRLIEWVQHK